MILTRIRPAARQVPFVAFVSAAGGNAVLIDQDAPSRRSAVALIVVSIAKEKAGDRSPALSVTSGDGQT